MCLLYCQGTTCRKHPLKGGCLHSKLQNRVDLHAAQSTEMRGAMIVCRAIQLILVNPNKQVMRRLDLAGIPDKLGREWIFVRVLDAVTYAQEFLRSSLLIEGSTWLSKGTKADTTAV